MARRKGRHSPPCRQGQRGGVGTAETPLKTILEDKNPFPVHGWHSDVQAGSAWQVPIAKPAVPSHMAVVSMPMGLGKGPDTQICLLGPTSRHKVTMAQPLHHHHASSGMQSS